MPINPVMASRRYPPVPKTARRIIWLGRAISAIGLVIGVYVGMQLASQGQTSRAFLILSLAAVYVLTTWVSALSPLLWVSVGGMVLIFVVLEPNVISLTLVVAVAVLFWMRGKGQTSPIDPAGLRPVASDAVMPGAEGFVTQLTERGWRQAGAYAFDSKRASVTASVLVHPDLDRYADITDMVFGIESRFEGSRMLITLNTGHGSLPPNYLGNGLVGASPTELADAHQQALDILAPSTLPLSRSTRRRWSRRRWLPKLKRSSGASRTRRGACSTSAAALASSMSRLRLEAGSKPGWPLNE